MATNEQTENVNRRSSSRDHRYTEKGLQYEKSIVLKRFKEAVSTWRSCVSRVTILLSDEKDIQIVRQGRDELNLLFNEVHAIHVRIDELQMESSESELMLLSDVFSSLELDHQNLMINISDVINDLQMEIKSQVSGSHSYKGSCKSSRLSRISSTSKRSNAIFEAATLKTKLKYLDDENKAKTELERIKTQKQLEVANVKIGVFDGFDDRATIHDEIDRSEFTENYVKTNGFENIRVLPSCHGDQDNQESKSEFKSDQHHRALSHDHNSNDDQTCRKVMPVKKPDLSHDIVMLASLADELSLSRLPPPELYVFKGDALDYPGWKSAFYLLIEKKNIPSSEKIHYLRKYLSSEVQEVVSHFFLLSSEQAYSEAKLLLDKRYGDNFVISNAFRNKLENWPKIQCKDSIGLRRFADFLKQCSTAMETLGCLNIFNDERENRKCLVKLPEWIVLKWNRIVYKSKEQTGKFPSFKEFMHFVTKEADIACDPVTSLCSLKENDSQPSSRSVRARSFMSEVKDKPCSWSDTATSNKFDCVYCKGYHNLDQCSGFLAVTLEKRKLFVRENGLCYGCLRKGHTANKCYKKKKCETCGRMHPTVLHEYRPQFNPNSYKDRDQTPVSHVSHLTHAGSCSLSSLILPVYVSHKNSPDKEVMVYAMLDSQSDTTFVTEDTCAQLGISGDEITLLLSTLYAENKVVGSHIITGLSVRGYNATQRISLPQSYTRHTVPANRNHIPTPDMARKWPHLRQIENQIAPLQDVEIGLLIGYNCSRALLPRDVIAPVNNGPFAQRTDLGWSIVGTVGVDNDFENTNLDVVGLSHRVMVCKVDPLLLGGKDSPGTVDVMVSLRNKVKPLISPTDVIKVMSMDFNDQKGYEIPFSRKDKLFLEILKENIERVEGHYQMPLPFSDRQITLPNNYALAYSRLKHLKCRFKRDKVYHTQYCSFMQDMIIKGHAERVPSSDLKTNNGRTWYIPHHGVFHHRKPEKLRVVFDCSAEYIGASLNKHLLQGPDLINALVGVLCRFRKDYVPIMCDVEQMFFQFLVCPDDRDFLRFLWW